MTRRILLVPLFALFFLSFGCAGAAPKKDYTVFRSADPHSILVVPVVNNTTNVDAPGLFLSTIPIPVAERGYYVFPVNMVKRVLEDEGLSDPNLVHTADTGRLCNLFGADSVLYVSIEAWTAQYMLIATQVTVEFDYVMKDGKTGDTIWKEHKRIVYAPQQNSGGSPLAALVAAAVQAAVTKAAPNYMPLAQQANAEVFNTPGVGLPAGPHHKEYGKPAEPGK